MMALSKKMLEDGPSDIELLLPWYAAGTLTARDARRVEEALARDPDLARQFAVIREEYAETIVVNESLGAPSGRPLQKLFAAIDAEPERRRRARVGLVARVSGFFASLSLRTLAWCVSLGALVLVLQAGVIATVLIGNQSAPYQTASLGMNEPVVHYLGGAAPPRALVRFAPEARIADITALLDKYQASIIGRARDDMFRLQFGDQAMSKEDRSSVINKLSGEKSVSLAVPAQ
ncbi:zf-HC2 domain-containing protein [Bradyrhizobium sp. ARR65]|uniref:zf-HC2 domain-containing protein n=1 Tax=Bradyrhizobium sp. ARR65 TaxID=1040989 RepID=UPI000463661C|nr:zf-HC2 domain-containing protein [Bradyrhizobium sp. ARR65]